LERNPCPSSRSESEIEARAARTAVGYRYAGAMCLDDLHDDCQPQTGANSLAAPEPLKDALPILGCDAGTAIRHAQRTDRIDLDDDLGSRRRTQERVLDQIAPKLLSAGLTI
jgi:hypothetical protein